MIASKNLFGKFLRGLGILLMSVTALFTLASGAGTSCVALAAEKYGESFAPIAPYGWLYIIFVVVTLAIGVMGVRAVLLLIRGRSEAYRFSLLTLLLGILVGAIHMVISRSLRGKSMPVDAVVFTTVLTLLVFLFFRLPGVWEKYNAAASSAKAGAAGAGLASIVNGMLMLTIQYWAGASHTMNGINYADVWHMPLTLAGWLLCLLGVAALVGCTLELRPAIARLRQAATL